MVHVAFVILTKNEEANLPFCLSSLAGLDADVFVIDSGSTDRTVSIARDFGATVLEHAWTTHAGQLNWALDNIETTAPWCMKIDADEQLTPELRDFIRERLPVLPPSVSAILVRLRVYFLNRWIRHGGLYPIWLLRIWRWGHGRAEPRSMDEHIVVSSDAALQVEADLIHDNRKGLDEWIAKHVRYASLECCDLQLQSADTSCSLIGQASRKRWLKEKLYTRTPLFLRAWCYWFYRYFARLGLLDGAEGFVYHFLQALWYRSLVDAKVIEARRASAHRFGTAPSPSPLQTAPPEQP